MNTGIATPSAAAPCASMASVVVPNAAPHTSDSASAGDDMQACSAYSNTACKHAQRTTAQDVAASACVHRNHMLEPCSMKNCMRLLRPMMLLTCTLLRVGYIHAPDARLQSCSISITNLQPKPLGVFSLIRGPWRLVLVRYLQRMQASLMDRAHPQPPGLVQTALGHLRLVHVIKLPWAFPRAECRQNQ